MKIMILIAAYNEAQMIGKVLKKIPRRLPGFKQISCVVVDDGSSDQTYDIAKKHKVTVIRHIINRGLGGALGTGFEYARMKKVDILVTLDADGQHEPKDILRLIKPLMKNRSEVVIGSRLLGKNRMPIIRKTVNIFSNVATWLFFGFWTTDSQSGFRAFSKKAIDKIQIRTQRMEVSSEIFKEIKRNHLRVIEIPIEAIYSHYSLTKGQKVSNAGPVIARLFLRIMR